MESSQGNANIGKQGRLNVKSKALLKFSKMAPHIMNHAYIGKQGRVNVRSKALLKFRK